uniref:Protein-L-isoaspartate O-methyltransferase n=2 Tax=Elaeis guineensis var. tenera TaxID=51953 RepID=A0A8N4F084_ELAGV|nr:protein-L-isoaspartate O-methyltransferase isoform X4 [Elaeis guineensis]
MGSEEKRLWTIANEIHGVRLIKIDLNGKGNKLRTEMDAKILVALLAIVFLKFFWVVPIWTGGDLKNKISWHFWTRGSADKNNVLVEQLKQYGVIKTKKVAEVMETIDRGLFVPDGNSAYIDSPMPIGYNATISAPHMHGTCLELLKEHLQPGMHALDVGSGTGYLTACFAMMVGPQGRAVGVEHIPELVASSIENVKRSAASSLLNGGSLSLHVADGRQGWPEQAPYDAIHVGAAAEKIPQPLLDQLKPGGRMVIPVGSFFQDLQVVDKKLDGSISIRSETSVRYVPLTSRAAQLQGF